MILSLMFEQSGIAGQNVSITPNANGTLMTEGLKCADLSRPASFENALDVLGVRGPATFLREVRSNINVNADVKLN